VYAVSRDAVRAAEYGQRSLEASHEQGPFLSAYEHESLPRAAAVDGDAATRDIHLAEARALLGDVTDPEERALLEADLRGIAP
jgi:hypothetical protein